MHVNERRKGGLCENYVISTFMIKYNLIPDQFNHRMICVWQSGMSQNCEDNKTFVSLSVHKCH